MDKFTSASKFLKRVEAENIKMLGFGDDAKSGLLYEIRILSAAKTIDAEQEAKLMGPINHYLEWVKEMEAGKKFVVAHFDD